MPLMPLVVDQPVTASSALTRVEYYDVHGSTGGPQGQNYVVPETDPYVETPIAFVPGLKAQPSREPQNEPVGSGPFGF